MNYDADLVGIMNLMRRHIEIRNHSRMKRIHQCCFVAHDAVDFLVEQGLAASRDDALIICRRMESNGMIKSVSGGKFKDAKLDFRFVEDDGPEAALANTSAGNGDGVFYGQGGCKFNIAPHTAHNSFVLNIALAEELERAIAGASVESRVHAIGKLRQRVMQEAGPSAPDWLLSESTTVNDTPLNVYRRKRPRGNFDNVKMTSTVGVSPKDFARAILNFDTRKEWESNFEDGVIVEAIDTGELSPFFADKAAGDATAAGAEGAASPPPPSPSPKAMPLPEAPKQIPNLARQTDDVLTYLSTIDISSIPKGMSIAFLNDPERQHALQYLRKQIMAAQPPNCLICDTPFNSPADIRFCPCCATAACVECMSKKVYEVASKQIVNVCVHCYRESTRIWQPPENITNNSQLEESLRGKWWRPEKVAVFVPGTTDAAPPQTPVAPPSPTVATSPVPDGKIDALGIEYASDDDDVIADTSLGNNEEDAISKLLAPAEVVPEPAAATVEFEEPDLTSVTCTEITATDEAAAAGTTETASDAAATKDSLKTARCKKCGEVISREIEAIEKHMEECTRNKLRDLNIGDDVQRNRINNRSGNAGSWWSTPKHLAGIIRKPELQKAGTRIIYRTCKGRSNVARPREVCALQDSFVDPSGNCYVYEISVRHCDVRGIPGHITEEVLLLLHVASPVRGNNKSSAITIISQMDEKSRAPRWIRSLTSGSTSNTSAAPYKADMMRELGAQGTLKNTIDKQEEGGDAEDGDKDPNAPSLDVFDLLTVLGRGGFGKVMQVRFKPTGDIYAMKILKKSELKRRRQVERTKTERTILAVVKHPFIVELHFAFQNNAKLYMIMDFVQGGDFFTLMRKFKRMNEDWVRIYVSEIAMALQHLHDMDIIYRDLKPENILLCGDGHLKLTDFGLSRYFVTRPPEAEDMTGPEEDHLTRSFCGTEQYMPPEMLLQRGHNWRMDWWCLGLLMHEMISTRHPFNGPSHYDTLRNMVTKQPVVDSRLSPAAVAVVRGLLEKAPKSRLCCKTGINELKSLPFFASIDWDALYQRKVKAPYVPELTTKEDTSLFETTFTKEAPVDSIAEPVKASKTGKSGGGILGFFGFKKDVPNQNANADATAFDGFEYGSAVAPATLAAHTA